MSILPRTQEDHWSLILSALGAYIIGVPVVGVLSKIIATIAGWNNLGKAWYGAHALLQEEEARRYSVLGCGYILCLVGLFLVVPALRDKRTRRAALAVWALGLVFLIIFIYPATQVVRTR